VTPRSRLRDIDTGLVPAGGSQGKRKKVIRQHNHVSRLRRSNLEIQGEFRVGFLASVIPRAWTRPFAFLVAPKSLETGQK